MALPQWFKGLGTDKNSGRTPPAHTDSVLQASKAPESMPEPGALSVSCGSRGVSRAADIDAAQAMVRAVASHSGNRPIAYKHGQGQYVPPGGKSVIADRESRIAKPAPATPAITDSQSAINNSVEIVKLTTAEILKQCRRVELKPIALGELFQRYIDEQAPRDRAAVIKELHGLLVADDLAGVAQRIDKCIAGYWVIRTLLIPAGKQPQVRWAAVREFTRLLARDSASEQWAIRRGLEEPTRSLWARYLAERLTAAAVRLAIQAIRPKRAMHRIGPRRVEFSRVLKQVEKLKLAAEEIRELERLLAERKTALAALSSPQSEAAA